PGRAPSPPPEGAHPSSPPESGQSTERGPRPAPGRCPRDGLGPGTSGKVSGTKEAIIITMPGRDDPVPAPYPARASGPLRKGECHGGSQDDRRRQRGRISLRPADAGDQPREREGGGERPEGDRRGRRPGGHGGPQGLQEVVAPDSGGARRPAQQAGRPPRQGLAATGRDGDLPDRQA